MILVSINIKEKTQWIILQPDFKFMISKILITKINTSYEVTFGDELTSNMSPFFKFYR